MAEPIETKRRLVAIFAADVEGYSRLMGADEVATLDTLTARREILDGLIATHGGRMAAPYAAMTSPFWREFPCHHCLHSMEIKISDAAQWIEQLPCAGKVSLRPR